MQEWRHAFQLFFDRDSEVTIHGLIDQFRSSGLVNQNFISGSYRPHISLSVYRDLDKRFAVNAAETVANQCASFEFQFSYIGFFNGDINALYLGPAVSEELREAHRLIHRQFTGRPEQCWELYLPNLWVPHCGILVDDNPHKLLEGAARLIEQQLPRVRVGSVGVTGFNDIYEFPLRLSETVR